MKTIKTITLTASVLLTLTFTLTGCRSTRSTEGRAVLTKKQRSELLTPLAQYPPDVQAIIAKTAITLDYNGYPVDVKGRLRMRRDEAVQMTVTALGLMEIAAIEFTPNGAYLIDKVNKRYARFDYTSGWMKLAGINFNTVQALFWNRLFIPGEKDTWRHAADFTLTETGGQCLIEPGLQRMLKCSFYTDADCRKLQQTDLRLQQYVATWRYGQFDSIGTYTYPTTHDVSISGSSRAIGARIGLSDISTLDTGWKSSTDLSRYKEVDLEQLMSILNMIR